MGHHFLPGNLIPFLIEKEPIDNQECENEHGPRYSCSQTNAPTVFLGFKVVYLYIHSSHHCTAKIVTSWQSRPMRSPAQAIFLMPTNCLIYLSSYSSNLSWKAFRRTHGKGIAHYRQTWEAEARRREWDARLYIPRPHMVLASPIDFPSLGCGQLASFRPTLSGI